MIPTRILALDDGLVRQKALLRRSRAGILPLGGWGPRVRLGCSWRAFRRLERDLTELAGPADRGPSVSFCGSGDFHHISLALLRRRRSPCNLLVLDNHPDWMRGVPFLHCGTWLYHAARLPHVGRIFHVGGEVDFDNGYHWMAPWPMLRAGKIVVLPAVRQFQGRGWDKVPHDTLRPSPGSYLRRERIEQWLQRYRKELASRPLYISLDKDVMAADEAVVNWDSGRLLFPEVRDVLEAFLAATRGDLAGMDVVGDWSAVRLRGLVRHALHYTEHPALAVDPVAATRRNEALNLTLLDVVARACGRGTIRRTGWDDGLRRPA